MSLNYCCLLASMAGLIALSGLSTAAVYLGSGTSGFGGAVGGSQMTWSDAGSTVLVSFTKGAGGFNDRMVIYLDSGSTGRNTIDIAVNDRQDALRSAISYVEAAAAKTLSLPPGFEATHAIAIDTTFGGLWEIPNTGNIVDNGLVYKGSVASSLAAAGQATFSFSFNVADLGITPNSGSKIDFVVTYLDPFGGDNSRGFVSNEGYGGTFGSDNIGQNDFAFTSGQAYTIVPEPSSALLGACATLALLRRRRI